MWIIESDFSLVSVCVDPSLLSVDEQQNAQVYVEYPQFDDEQRKLLRQLFFC